MDMKDFQPQQGDSSDPAPSPMDRGDLNRLVAGLVLLPTVPLLLLSLLALVLFYVAPSRFSDLLALLPGDRFIRSALAFAPVTLFAVVVLAVLYVLDRPPKTEAQPAIEGISISPGLAFGRAILVLGVPALLLSSVAFILSFVAPGRFWAVLDPLPGERYLRVLVQAAPLLLLALVLPAAFFVVIRRSGDQGLRDPKAGPPVARLAAGTMLITALPFLFASLAALGIFYLSPTRFQALMDRLSEETFVRLALIFTPFTLLTIVLLAALYFVISPGAGTAFKGEPEMEREAPVRVWALAAGLMVSSIVGLGLLIAIAVLVF